MVERLAPSSVSGKFPATPNRDTVTRDVVAVAPGTSASHRLIPESVVSTDCRAVGEMRLLAVRQSDTLRISEVFDK